MPEWHAAAARRCIVQRWRAPRAGTLGAAPELVELRARIEQRLAIGHRHIPIGRLDAAAPSGTATTLALIRPALLPLTQGSPRWARPEAIDAAASPDELPAFATPSELCRILCRRVQARMTHVAGIDHGVARFAARLAIKARERFGWSIPQRSAGEPGYCRHFATTVARAYTAVAERDARLADTTVVIVAGVPQCSPELGKLHAWNWLVDFARGTIAAFEPQDETCADSYANISALLFTLALTRPADGVRGLRLLVRRHDSLHGAMVLFHLARHPIDRASRWAIAARLRAARFERIVPGWEQELAAWDRAWPRTQREIVVDEIVRHADGH